MKFSLRKHQNTINQTLSMIMNSNKDLLHKNIFFFLVLICFWIIITDPSLVSLHFSTTECFHF